MHVFRNGSFPSIRGEVGEYDFECQMQLPVMWTTLDASTYLQASANLFLFEWLRAH